MAPPETSVLTYEIAEPTFSVREGQDMGARGPGEDSPGLQVQNALLPGMLRQVWPWIAIPWLVIGLLVWAAR